MNTLTLIAALTLSATEPTISAEVPENVEQVVAAKQAHEARIARAEQQAELIRNVGMKDSRLPAFTVVRAPELEIHQPVVTLNTQEILANRPRIARPADPGEIALATPAR
ncbi:MAG: hypothetical protein ACFB9M_09670 [Myxococcota bacterium]